MKGKMKLVLVFFLSVLALLQGAAARKVVCYYSSWATYYGDGAAGVNPEDLDPNLCTHINYAFVSLAGDGSLQVLDQTADIDKGGYSKTVALKQQNGALKVLLSIGGGNAPASLFAQVAADPNLRGNLVRSARSFMETYGFDGVDVDWEVPVASDRDNFVLLLQDLKNDFSRNGWLVSAALAANPTEGYDTGRMNDLLDIFNIMAYDFYGPWSQYTGQNAALFASGVESEWEKQNLNTAAAITNWLNAGVNPDKIVMGLAFYGRSFTLADPGNNGLHAPYSGPGNGGPVTQSPGLWNYFEWCPQMNSWDCRWDDEQKVPICLAGGNQWLGIDTAESIREKVNHINSRGIGGIMTWTVNQDDVHGSCGEKQSLLRTAVNTLK